MYLSFFSYGKSFFMYWIFLDIRVGFLNAEKVDWIKNREPYTG